MGRKVQADARNQGAAAAAAPPGLDGARHAAAQRAAREAGVIRDELVPAYMAEAAGVGGALTPAGYRAYLDRLFEEAGSPADPVDRMALEQLAFVHLRVPQLHAKAAANQGEAAELYSRMAARLLGEFRRLAEGLRSRSGRATPPAEARRLRAVGGD